MRESHSRDTVVSEIIDCDNKTLPDVIPANVSSALSPLTTDCDITANLMSIYMDTTEDDERWESSSSCINMERTDELSKNLDGQMLHVDAAKSVEEKRSEFYIKDNAAEALPTSENDNSAQSKVLKCEEENVNHNNTLENVTRTPEIELPKADEIRIPCESNEDDDIVGIAVESNSSVADTEHVHIHLDSSSDFNSFQYWRTPIPQVEEDISKLKADNLAKSDGTTGQNENAHENNGLTLALSDSLNDLSVCDHILGSVMLGPSEGVEHDLRSAGQVQDETTVTVIDGVVQGTDLWNGKCFTLYANCSSFINCFVLSLGSLYMLYGLIFSSVCMC